jgi:DNA-binding XRE family transcriptional regulator
VARPVLLNAKQRLEVLEAARLRREISPKRLALKFGVSVQTIRRIENEVKVKDDCCA